MVASGALAMAFGPDVEAVSVSPRGLLDHEPIPSEGTAGYPRTKVLGRTKSLEFNLNLICPIQTLVQTFCGIPNLA